MLDGQWDVAVQQVPRTLEDVAAAFVRRCRLQNRSR